MCPFNCCWCQRTHISATCNLELKIQVPPGSPTPEAPPNHGTSEGRYLDSVGSEVVGDDIIMHEGHLGGLGGALAVLRGDDVGSLVGEALGKGRGTRCNGTDALMFEGSVDCTLTSTTLECRQTPFSITSHYKDTLVGRLVGTADLISGAMGSDRMHRHCQLTAMMAASWILAKLSSMNCKTG